MSLKLPIIIGAIIGIVFAVLNVLTLGGIMLFLLYPFNLTFGLPLFLFELIGCHGEGCWVYVMIFAMLEFILFSVIIFLLFYFNYRYFLKKERNGRRYIIMIDALFIALVLWSLIVMIKTICPPRELGADPAPKIWQNVSYFLSGGVCLPE